MMALGPDQEWWCYQVNGNRLTVHNNWAYERHAHTPCTTCRILAKVAEWLHWCRDQQEASAEQHRVQLLKGHTVSVEGPHEYKDTNVKHQDLLAVVYVCVSFDTTEGERGQCFSLDVVLKCSSGLRKPHRPDTDSVSSPCTSILLLPSICLISETLHLSRILCTLTDTSMFWTAASWLTVNHNLRVLSWNITMKSNTQNYTWQDLS